MARHTATTPPSSAPDDGGAGDTIAAIATATGGGIGIVRVSGPRAEELAARLVRPWPTAPATHRLYRGVVHEPSTGEPLDEVLACVMRAPRSYTGDDVVELQGHGGAASLARLLAATVAAGARLAEPGEFTRRAFLAGRMDLAQAEAVADVIAARSESALRVAQSQLRGELGARVRRLRDGVVDALADVEADIDFPDERLDVRAGAVLARGLDGLRSLGREVAALASTYARGRRVCHGLDVALVGRANAGKSSLLNALAGEERALVDEAPGTTRDVVEAEVDLGGGVRAVVADTAGERATESSVEERGLALGRERRARADVVVVVVDGTVGRGELEARLVAEARAALVVWNKADVAPSPASALGEPAPLAVSARTGAGVGELRAALRRLVDDGHVDGGEVVVSSARQAAALDEAARAIERAVGLLAASEPPELAALDLRVALDRLARVTGEAARTDVLDAIFARFCIGK